MGITGKVPLIRSDSDSIIFASERIAGTNQMGIIAAGKSTTTYRVPLVDIVTLVARDLGISPDQVTVRYHLASDDWDGPGVARQRVEYIEVTVK